MAARSYIGEKFCWKVRQKILGSTAYLPPPPAATPAVDLSPIPDSERGSSCQFQYAVLWHYRKQLKTQVAAVPVRSLWAVPVEELRVLEREKR